MHYPLFTPGNRGGEDVVLSARSVLFIGKDDLFRMVMNAWAYEDTVPTV